MSDQTSLGTNKYRKEKRPAYGHLARRTRLILFGSYAAVVLILAAGTWALIASDRARELKRQEAELTSLTRALAERVARTLGEADRSMQAIATTLRETSGVDATASDRLRQQVAEWSLSVPQAAVLSATRANGERVLSLRQRGLHSSVVAPPTSAELWRGRPYNELHIGPPIRFASAGEQAWYLPLERAVADDDGNLLAIVSSMIAVQDFEEFYEDIRLTPQDAITVLTTDARVLVRYPLGHEIMGRQLSAAQRLLDNAGSAPAVFRGEFAIASATALGVLRRLGEYPLLVVVTRPESVALAAFNTMSRRLLFGTALLICLLSVIAWISYRDVRKREADRALLDRTNAALEARVNRRSAELEQSNRELIAFSYSISHDLRAPLRAINGFAHAVKEDYGDRLDEQGREYLERIYRASLRMGELIDELLSLANVSRQPLSVKSIDLTAMAYEIIEELRIAEPNRKVQFEAEPGMRTEGDEALLRNALSNLLHNAWKFTRGRLPGVITVTSSDDPDFVRYTVADNGVGFDMTHAKRLFQPFQQLHSNQGFGGTGIGLASVHRIIERHGGRILAESEPDQGARFIIELPHRAAVVRRRQRTAGTPGNSDEMTRLG